MTETNYEKRTSKGKTVRRTVLIALTPEEWPVLASKLAETGKEIQDLRIQRMKTDKNILARIRLRKSQLNQLQLVALDKAELREVDCLEIFNWDQNQCEYWRDGLMLEKREITFEERQLEFTGASVPAAAPIANELGL